MSDNTSIVEKNKSIIDSEFDDLLERVNTLEANMVESKEFTHLSAEVFAILQNQINEIKIVINHIVKGQIESKKPAESNDLLYF